MPIVATLHTDSEIDKRVLNEKSMLLGGLTLTATLLLAGCGKSDDVLVVGTNAAFLLLNMLAAKVAMKSKALISIWPSKSLKMRARRSKSKT